MSCRLYHCLSTGACGDPPKQLSSSCSAECHPEGCLPPAAVVLLVMLLQPRAVTLRDERVTEGHRDTISETGSPMPPPLGAPATADWECCADAATACAACPLELAEPILQRRLRDWDSQPVSPALTIQKDSRHPRQLD